MEQVNLEKEVTSSTKKNLETYFATHDVQYITKDAVFTNMSSGEEAKGREEVKQLLESIYHVIFDAKAEIVNTIITENSAVLEFNFKGKHIGAMGQIQPTNKEVNVPTCIVYDVENGLVKRARIYMQNDVMMKQLTATN